jgi:hypothetical protein
MPPPNCKRVIIPERIEHQIEPEPRAAVRGTFAASAPQYEIESSFSKAAMALRFARLCGHALVGIDKQTVFPRQSVTGPTHQPSLP